MFWKAITRGKGKSSGSSQLVLHIGSHKTGTTSIQRACRQHLPRGVHYLDIRRPETRILQWRGRLDRFRVTLDLAAAEQVLRPQPEGGLHVTSNELLFWLDDPAALDALAAMLRDRFDAVTVLCYLRRQDRLALAHRKQVIAGTLATRFYGIDVTPLPRYRPHLQSYFDYAAKLGDLWAAAFGKDNVQVIPYRRDALVNADAVDDFAHRCGLAFRNKTPLAFNSSWAGNQTALGLYLIREGFAEEDRLSLLNALPPEGDFLPTRDEARAFLAHFDAANDRLARDWQWQGAPFRFETGFDMYPDPPAPRWEEADFIDMLRAASDHRAKERIPPC
ncbi:hypothetical protein [Shimia biformata]|uniref:hypothetical protein n=1 Tax=Shimia biformata TaxID=1294299 RepID=UPI0019528B77|nr:hypothetical protein [Shimia biformata]